jgi:hypothetical protein
MARDHYQYWRTRLEKLEEAFEDPKNANLKSFLKDGRNPRDRAGYIAAICVAIFAVLAFAAAIASVALAGVTYKQAKYGNSMVSVASTSADRSAALAAALNGSTSSPVTIVACCSPSTTGNDSMVFSSSILNTGTVLNTTTVAILTEVITVFATLTVTNTV